MAVDVECCLWHPEDVGPLKKIVLKSLALKKILYISCLQKHFVTYGLQFLVEHIMEDTWNNYS